MVVISSPETIKKVNLKKLILTFELYELARYSPETNT